MSGRESGASVPSAGGAPARSTVTPLLPQALLSLLLVMLLILDAQLVLPRAAPEQAEPAAAPRVIHDPSRGELRLEGRFDPARHAFGVAYTGLGLGRVAELLPRACRGAGRRSMTPEKREQLATWLGALLDATAALGGATARRDAALRRLRDGLGRLEALAGRLPAGSASGPAPEEIARRLESIRRGLEERR